MMIASYVRTKTPGSGGQLKELSKTAGGYNGYYVNYDYGITALILMVYK